MCKFKAISYVNLRYPSRFIKARPKTIQPLDREQKVRILCIRSVYLLLKVGNYLPLTHHHILYVSDPDSFSVFLTKYFNHIFRLW
jgi:hypothetical protein